MFCVDIGRVDIMNNFWDWEGCDVVNGVGFGYFVCDMVLNCVVFIEVCGVDGYVVSGFVIGCVFEFYVWEFFCDVDGWVYVVERGSED